MSSEVPTKFAKILAAVDGSDNAIRAGHASIALAANLHSELIFLSVVTSPNLFVPTRVGHAPPPITYQGYWDQAMKQASKLVDDLTSLAKRQGVKSVRGEILRSTGSVVEDIITYSETKGVDLIVTGTRGTGGFKKLLIGSVSSGIVAHAKISVLVVR